MLLTQKLLTFLNRVFDKDPAKFLALRLSYAGGMTWSVKDAVLTTTVTGGPGQSLSIDLTQFTVSTLVNFLATKPGYSVLYVDGTDLAQLSARLLLDDSGDIALSNGDHIHGYTSVLWAYLESAALELEAARLAIVEMLKQMSTTTAGDVWLDELGGYYGIPRLAGELDQQYGPRIIAEVLRPRANNVAMELAIKVFTGQDATVTDVVEWSGLLPKYNGAITHNAGSTYNSAAQPLYGLFDVEYGYDLLNGGDIVAFQTTVAGLVNRLRDAGTHLRSVLLKGSSLSDDFLFAPTDDTDIGLVVGVPLADTLDAPTEDSAPMDAQLAAMEDTDAMAGAVDSTGVNYTFTHKYDSTRSHNGDIYHRGGYTFSGATLENDLAGTQALTP